MQELRIDKPWRRAKVFGAIVAGIAGMVILVLIAVTHEPKSAVSSPGPAKAAIVPQIADTKSEAELLFRGKSFSVLQRKIVMPYGGEILSIPAKEGETVNKDDTLATYKLDRLSMMEVHQIIYPQQVLSLKKTAENQQIEIERLNKVTLPLKKIEVERIEKELSDLRELRSKDLAPADAVTNKQRQLEAAKKEILDVTEALKQAEINLARTLEDLRFYEQKQKRDLDFLEWQTNRSYSESDVPLDNANLKAPISGQLIWMAPELRVNAEVPKGLPVMTIAPVTPMIVRCKAHELELVKLKTGDRGTVNFDAIPDKSYSCKISRIPGVSRNPALEVPADYEIECVLDNPDGQIRDGLSCNVKVSVTQ
ncbi:MAG TPA: HlyD family efflux transporter periplasmic adaptor subunit [Desulfomonilaceae bacterium]|nr:HlyD family efflux transporter periplasmic adaptor subunit [Desulfomonilaceae bacterium]